MAPVVSAEISAWGLNHLGSDIERGRQVGLNWYRLGASWAQQERTPGVYDFSAMDTEMALARSKGFQVVATVGVGYAWDIPQWLKDQGGVNNPSYADYLARYVSAVARRYRGQVGAYQLENELNHIGLEQFFQTHRREGTWSDAKIRDILVKGSQAIRAADPGARILVNVESDNPNWWTFLARVTWEWKVSYDIIGIDMYPNYLAVDPALGLALGPVVSTARTSFGRQVWVTETGYSTYETTGYFIDGIVDLKHTEDNQAAYLRYAVRASRDAGATGMFVYTTRDSTGTSFNNIEKYFGLLRADGTSKPAWGEYGRLVAGYKDTDMDGVPDSTDKCPWLPEDRDGWADADGCPDPDNDGDGWLDLVDRCPNQREDYNHPWWEVWKNDGCPG
ncbi:MAG: beta-galactosidase [Euryarchaeota archaeon]|nr:beta-galactosidase [Euryarchaeota archaeon]